jgi:hypothetical protein
MKKRTTTIKEDFNEIGSILNGIKDQTNAVSVDSRLSWLMDKDLRYKLFEKNPDCFICIGKNGYDIPIFPICNRMALEDPAMIDFSIRLAKRMLQSGVLDRNDMSRIIAQISAIRDRLDQE